MIGINLMKRLTVTINGDKWKVALMDAKSFRAKHGSGTDAITVYHHVKNYRTIDFKDTTLLKSTVVHEVTHAYLSYIDLSKFSYGAVEEKFCDLLGYKAHLILRVSETIWRSLR